MPYEEGSCLNEEYTNLIKEICNHLTEAKCKYEKLPASCRAVITEHEINIGHSLGYFLIFGEKSALNFAKEFGIKVEEE